MSTGVTELLGSSFIHPGSDDDLNLAETVIGSAEWSEPTNGRSERSNQK